MPSFVGVVGGGVCRYPPFPRGVLLKRILVFFPEFLYALNVFYLFPWAFFFSGFSLFCCLCSLCRLETCWPCRNKTNSGGCDGNLAVWKCGHLLKRKTHVELYPTTSKKIAYHCQHEKLARGLCKSVLGVASMGSLRMFMTLLCFAGKKSGSFFRRWDHSKLSVEISSPGECNSLRLQELQLLAACIDVAVGLIGLIKKLF